MKKIKLLFVLLSIGILIIPNIAFAAQKWNDLGSGWKIRLDPPAPSDGNKWHVHDESNNGKYKASENVDGTKHDGETLDKLPNDVKKKARNSNDYKKGIRNQKNTDSAKLSIKSSKLNVKNCLHWAAIFGILVTYGIAIYFTGGAALIVLA